MLNKKKGANRMKTLIMALVAAIAVAAPAVSAEKKFDGAKPGQGPVREEGMRRGAGPWVAHVLMFGDNLEKIGIKDKKLREEIKTSLRVQRKKSSDIEKKIREISREQAKMMRTFLSDKGCSAEEIYAKINEVSSLRAEQGRIAVEMMAVLRDKLTPEQLKAAMILIRKGAMARGDGEGPRPRMRDGEGPRPRMRDGEGPRPEFRDGEGPKPEFGDGEEPLRIKRGRRKGNGKDARDGKRPLKKRRQAENAEEPKDEGNQN